MLEQQLDDAGVRAGRGAVQRGHVDALVPRDEPDLGSVLDEDLRRSLLAEERRVVERREAVGRPGAGELRLGVEQLLEGARAADGGRVEHVERRVRGQQDVDEPRLPVVERLKDG